MKNFSVSKYWLNGWILKYNSFEDEKSASCKGDRSFCLKYNNRRPPVRFIRAYRLSVFVRRFADTLNIPLLNKEQYKVLSSIIADEV